MLPACGGWRGDAAMPAAELGEWRRGLALAGVDSGVPVAVSGGVRVRCDTAPHEPTRYRETSIGGLRFEVPPTWEVSRTWQYGVIFRVPDLADPRHEAGADVSVITAWLGPAPDVARLTRDLRAATARRASGPLLVDTVPDFHHSYIWWSQDVRGTLYSFFDDHGWVEGPLVHVLFKVPLLKDRPRAAYEALSRDSRHLLATLTFDGRRVFPGWALHPVVECYAPTGATP